MVRKPRHIPSIPAPSPTILMMLEASADDLPGGIRVLDRRERAEERSRNALISNAQELARGLMACGVRNGDRVAIILPTCHGFLDAFFGTQWAGAIPAALYPPVRLGRLDEYVSKTVRMLQSLQVEMLITDSRCSKLLGQVVRESGVSITTVEELKNNSKPAQLYKPTPDDVAFIQFSSGSTRDPAPAVLTHAHVMANVEAICHELPDEALEGGGGCVGWLPLYHDMGLLGCMLTTIRCQRELTLIPPELFLVKPAVWLRAISEYGAHVTTAPNFAYARCVTHISDDELEGADLSAWIVAMNGAEPVSADTMRAFADRFSMYGFRRQALLPVYGMSEAALAVSFSNAFQATVFDRDELSKGRAIPAAEGVELVSVGHPLVGFDLEIREDSRVLADGQVGAIFARGPSIMKGYWGRPNPVEAGWLDTGDLGFFHEQQLYICGRAKDVLIVHGRNHAPQDVEDAVSRLEGIREGCVIAVSDLADGSENLLVFAEFREPDSQSAEGCIKAVRAATGLTVDFVALLEPGTLPRTSSGKLRRQIALEQWRSGELRPPQKVTPTMLAGAMLKSYWNLRRAKK